MLMLIGDDDDDGDKYIFYSIGLLYFSAAWDAPFL